MDSAQLLLKEIPELRTVALLAAFFCCTSVTLYFIFKVMSKGQQLIWMMFGTVVELSVSALACFLSLFCLGILMKDFMTVGLHGMFPTATDIYHSYIMTPFVYSWSDCIIELQKLLPSFNLDVTGMFRQLFQ